MKTKTPALKIKIILISLEIFILNIFTLSCNPTQSPPINKPSPIASVISPANTASTSIPQIKESSPTPTPNSEDLFPSYHIRAELNYSLHQVEFHEIITYTNRSTEKLNNILLMIEPNRYDGTFQLQELLINGKSPTSTPELQSNQMLLELEQPLEPQQTIILDIAYQLHLPQPIPSPTTRPVPFGWTPRQTNLVDWYPFIPPYIEGKGWVAHKPGYFGEHLAYETANFEIILVNKGKEILSAPTSLADSGETQAGHLTVAASAMAQIEGNEIHYKLQKARTFALSISHDYLIQTQMVGNIFVIGYSFPIHVQAGAAALKTTSQALELFQNLFSSYPHSTLSVVEADFLDGMEYDGLYFLSNGFYNLYQGNPTEYLVAIAAHETSHQWWFGLVGNDQAEDPWLDESFATYSEKLFYEFNYPDAQSWWWAYRIDFFKPSGYINGSIYSFETNPNPYESYRNAVYFNGAKFLEDLRKTMGDEAFFQFIKTYAETYSYQIVTTQDFLQLLKKNTSVNLDNLINQYFNFP
ncbi:MAG: M1 family metallopeptidase [Anaerolineales bacterium]